MVMKYSSASAFGVVSLPSLEIYLGSVMSVLIRHAFKLPRAFDFAPQLIVVTCQICVSVCQVFGSVCQLFDPVCQIFIRVCQLFNPACQLYESFLEDRCSSVTAAHFIAAAFTIMKNPVCSTAIAPNFEIDTYKCRKVFRGTPRTSRATHLH